MGAACDTLIFMLKYIVLNNRLHASSYSPLGNDVPSYVPLFLKQSDFVIVFEL